MIRPDNINWVVEVTGRSRAEILKIQHESDKKGLVPVTTVLWRPRPKHKLVVDPMRTTGATITFRCEKCPYLLPVPRGRVYLMLTKGLKWNNWFGQTGTRCSS